jgi:hypothetical protein
VIETESKTAAALPAEDDDPDPHTRGLAEPVPVPPNGPSLAQVRIALAMEEFRVAATVTAQRIPVMLQPAMDAFKAWSVGFLREAARVHTALQRAGLIPPPPPSRCELAGQRRVATAMRRVERRAARRRRLERGTG